MEKNCAEESECDCSVACDQRQQLADSSSDDTAASVTSPRDVDKHRHRAHSSTGITQRYKPHDVGPEVEISPRDATSRRVTSESSRYTSFRVTDILRPSTSSSAERKPGSVCISESQIMSHIESIFISLAHCVLKFLASKCMYNSPPHLSCVLILPESTLTTDYSSGFPPWPPINCFSADFATFNSQLEILSSALRNASLQQM